MISGRGGISLTLAAAFIGLIVYLGLTTLPLYYNTITTGSPVPPPLPGASIPITSFNGQINAAMALVAFVIVLLLFRSRSPPAQNVGAPRR